MRLRSLLDVTLPGVDALPDGAVLVYDRALGRWVPRVLSGGGDVPSHTHAPTDITPQGAGSGLDADLLDGIHASSFALASHTHPAATTSSDGFLSAADKQKLDSVQAGAEVNQNAFSNVTVGSTTIAASSKSDNINLVAGSGVTLAADATNKSITISASSSANAFGVVRVGTTNVGAAGPSDVLTLQAGFGTVLSADALAKSVTVSWSPMTYSAVNSSAVTINSTSVIGIASVSVPAGGYLVFASCTFRANSTTAATLTMYLRDGSTTLVSVNGGSWSSSHGPLTLVIPYIGTISSSISLGASTSNSSYAFTAQANTGRIVALHIA